MFSIKEINYYYNMNHKFIYVTPETEIIAVRFEDNILSETNSTKSYMMDRFSGSSGSAGNPNNPDDFDGGTAYL